MKKSNFILNVAGRVTALWTHSNTAGSPCDDALLYTMFSSITPDNILGGINSLSVA